MLHILKAKRGLVVTSVFAQVEDDEEGNDNHFNGGCDEVSGRHGLGQDYNAMYNLDGDGLDSSGGEI